MYYARMKVVHDTPYSKSYSIVMRLAAAREGRIIVVMNESTPITKPAAIALIHSTI